MKKLITLLVLIIVCAISYNASNYGTRTFTATAYALKGKTASGEPVRKGIIAADPSILPLHTKVQVEAGSYTGTYIVKDTGGGIKGRHIDIWTPSTREAVKFGKRKVKLTVLSYGNKVSAIRRSRYADTD